MAGLADAFAAAERKRNGPQCRVGLLLSELDADDRVALETALLGTTYSTVLAEVLSQQGHEITDDPINRHRKGRCKCPRS